jgi:hypothetical protein
MLYIYFDSNCLSNVQLKLFCIMYVLHFRFSPAIRSSSITRIKCHWSLGSIKFHSHHEVNSKVDVSRNVVLIFLMIIDEDGTKSNSGLNSGKF